MAVACLVLGNQNGASAQGFNHDYPRLGIFVWNTHAPTEYFAKFDLVVTSNNGTAFAQAVKNKNPEAYVLFTRDIQAGQGAAPYASDWTVHRSDGGDVLIYGNNCPLADMTEFCPLVNGKQYNDVVPVYMSTLGNLNVFDGVSSDGMWEYPGTWCTNDIDLDRNGANDWNEHGESWVHTVWLNGVNIILSEFDRITNSKLFLVNSGGLHDYGYSLTNGMLLEKSWAVQSWNHFLGRYMSWMARARHPHIMFLDGCASFRPSGRPAQTKNDFQLMRFLLTTCMLGDGYFDFHTVEAGEHFWVKWYDEYNVQLGYPTTNYQRIHIEGPDWNQMAVHVRFFDNGAVIVNAKGKPQLVTDGDLAGLTGYEGPYYRFQGGQDPDYNNGEIFTDLNMDGILINESIGQIIGDAIILVKSPQTIISDIIIDNSTAGTSASSDAAELVGGWTNKHYGYSYTLVEANWMDQYGYASSYPGTGSNYAIYQPTFGFAGNYEVFEWHGFYGESASEYTEAKNVPCTISLGGGRTVERVIDQSVNYGQWNSLGTFFFTKGTEGRVLITNEADGIVLADAFKFVYVGGESDDIPPSEPRNLRGLNITDCEIDLAWDPPFTAPDGDTAMFYQVYRSGEMIGSTPATTYGDADLQENTNYPYSVYSVDNAGNRSAIPVSVTLTTSSDMTAPGIEMVQARNVSTIHVHFNESVEQITAETESNYTINKGVSVLAASLLDNLRTVELNTSPHVPEEAYVITINNIHDRSVNSNVIASNSTGSYSASADTMIVRLAADNAYELYVNGELIGSDDYWPIALSYSVPAISGKNVIAVKGIDNTDVGGLAGLVAEIDFKGERYVSNTHWKASNEEQAGWENVVFNDTNWGNATSYGIHGSAEPWASGNNVDNISENTNVHWIWTSDNVADNNAYFRFVINLEGDFTPPAPPTGISIAQ